MNPRFFLATAIVSLAAVTLSAAEPTKERPSRSEPLVLGSMKAWRIEDGQISLEASLLKGIEPAVAKRMLGGKDAAKTPVNAFLVRLPGKTVLVDSGMGKDPEEESGHLVERLAAAGVEPSEVDLILITHFHFDHIGGLVKADGTRAFPNAVLRVPRAEYDWWFGDQSKLPERLRGRVPKLKAIFSAYEAVGALRPFGAGDDLGNGIVARAAYGHTGGHTVYAFSSEGQELWCIGDLIHFGAVQFERPEVAVSFDLDSEKAVAARQDFFSRAAKSKAVLAGAHLPGFLRIEAKGEGFVAAPAVSAAPAAKP